MSGGDAPEWEDEEPTISMSTRYAAVGVGEVRTGARVFHYGTSRDAALLSARRLNTHPALRQSHDMYFDPVDDGRGPWCVAALVDITSGEDLSADSREVLAILAEECAEVVKVVTKVLRFGSRVNPWTGVHNKEQLESELGDVVAAIMLLTPEGGLANGDGLIDLQTVFDHASDKLDALRADDARLRHYRFPKDA